MKLTEADLVRLRMNDADGVQIAAEWGGDPERLSRLIAESEGTQPASAETVAEQNPMAAEFERLWYLLQGYELEPEFRFHTIRRWRFDYCHLPTRTAIELEGGVWAEGRHTRGSGFIADCEKYNAAARCGYTVFRLATGMIALEHIEPIIEYIEAATQA